MPFADNAYLARFSDLVFHELDPSVGYARECINVTPPAASAPVPLGTVVFRAKGVDPFAAYAVATTASLVETNEFAVVFGNHYGFNESFVPLAVNTTQFNAVSFKRGPVQLKEYYIKKAHSTFTATQFNSLKELLKKQGIIVEITL